MCLLQVVERLVDMGADMHLTDNEGRTALHLGGLCQPRRGLCCAVLCLVGACVLHVCMCLHVPLWLLMVLLLLLSPLLMAPSPASALQLRAAATRAWR